MSYRTDEQGEMGERGGRMHKATLTLCRLRAWHLDSNKKQLLEYQLFLRTGNSYMVGSDGRARPGTTKSTRQKS